jgi:hypothetical protein
VPLEGLAEEPNHARRLGLPGRLGLAPARRAGAHDPVGGHSARQGADVAVLEGPVGPQGDLDRLFAVGGHGRDVMAFQGGVDDAEPDLGLSPARAAASNTVTLSEPAYDGP